MFSDDGGDGTTSSSSRRRASMLDGRVRAFDVTIFLGGAMVLTGRPVATAFLAVFTPFLGAAFRGAAFLGAAGRTAAAFRAGLAGFRVPPAFLLAGFTAFLAAVLRTAAFVIGRAVALRAELDFFRDAAAFDVLLALRLAMMESFRNLDSVAISVVLSDAYRKSGGAFEHLLTEIAGRRTPLPERRHSYG